MTTLLGTALDVAIGLALIYLLLGLIASAAQETVAAMLKWRGTQLRDGLTALLAGTGAGARETDLVQNMLGHPLVQGTSGNGLPSYLSARNFTAALFQVLSDGSHSPLFSQIETSVAALPTDMPARQSLTALLRQAGGDLDKFTAAVQSWYNDAMDRLSGDYKRWSHYFALVFGLAVAIAFNVDSFRVAQTLWLDPQARSAVVAVAQHYVEQNKAPTDDAGKSVTDLSSQAKAAQSALNALDLPIGWKLAGSQISFGAIGTALQNAWRAVFDSDDGLTAVLSSLTTVLGWLATGLAVSLGAPFWFDTLQKLINLRGAGPKPDGAAQNAPASS